MSPRGSHGSLSPPDLTWTGTTKRHKSKSKTDSDWEPFKDQISNIIGNRKSWEQAVEAVQFLGIPDVT